MKSPLLFAVLFLLDLSSNAQTNLAIDGSRAIGDNVCCGFTPAQAFDGDLSTGPVINEFPASIGYDFGAPIIVDSYRWHCKTTIDRNDQPSSWQFQGSNDGISWTTIHTVTESPSVPGWSAHFRFRNINSYQYYRIYISSTLSNQAGIGELEMFRLSPPMINANLEVALSADNNLNGKVNPGEKLTYTTTITNTGGADASGVAMVAVAPANTKWVSGSLKTSVLTENDSFYSTSAYNTLIGTSVLANDFGLPGISVISFGNASNPSAILATGTNTGISNKGGIVKFSPDGTFTYTPPEGFSGYDQFAYTATSGIPPDGTGVVTVTVGSPVAPIDDHYNITGNVFNTQTVGVLANDGGGSLVLTEVEGKSANVGVPVKTVNGGVVNVQKNGSFTYYPPVGYEGTDSFVYTVNNSFNKPKTATVNLSILGMFWFVNNNAPYPGNGTLASPFKSLANFNEINNGLGNNPGPGDNIILYSSSSHYSGGIELLNDQKLIGQGASKGIGNICGITMAIGSAELPPYSGESPQVANEAGSVITLASGNTISGVDIGNSMKAAITGKSFGTLTVEDVRINTTGQALDLNNGTLNGGFANLVSQGGIHNIYLKDVATRGVSVLGASSDRLLGANDDAIRIEGADGSFSYSGSVTNASTLAINIANKSGGIVTVSGDINPSTLGKGVAVTGNRNGTIINFNGTIQRISSANGSGIYLSNNPGSNINFNGGGLYITSSKGDGFIASDGGIISVSGSNNIISCAGGVALKVVNTIIAQSGCIFKSISSNGGSNGIILDNTGEIGGLTVTGDGMLSSSGGIVQNSSGLDGQISGNGIYLNHTCKINLNYMKLNDHDNNAIYGSAVNDFTMQKMRFTGINGNNNSAEYEESAIHLVDLAGIVSLKNSFVSGGTFNNILVRNTSSENLTSSSLIFDTDTIEAIKDNSLEVRNVALQVIVKNGITHTQILNSRIWNWRGDAIRLAYQDLGSGTANIAGNEVINSSSAPSLSGGILVYGGDLSYTIANNNVQNVKRKAISVEKESFGKYLRGTISGNVIGSSGVTNSGAALGYGIQVTHCGSNSTSVTISNNVIKQVGRYEGIRVIGGEDEKGGGSGVINAIITGNEISEPGTNAVFAIYVQCGIPITDQDQMCLDMKLNKTLNYSTSILLKQMKSTRINLVGYTGTPTNTSLVSQFLRANNSLSQVSVSTSGGGYYNSAEGVSCPQ